MKTLIDEGTGECALGEGPLAWPSGEDRNDPGRLAKAGKGKRQTSHCGREEETPSGRMPRRVSACRGAALSRERHRAFLRLRRFLNSQVLRTALAPNARRGRRAIPVAGVFAVVLVALSAGCASAPLAAFPATHPASPEAPEASITRRQDLSMDQPTRATRDLLRKAGPSQGDSTQDGPSANH